MEYLRFRSPYRASRGFTLIELMVAIAVVAIITAVALPSFQQSIRKSRRANAFATVAAIQQSQERWRANNPTFSTSMDDDHLRVSSPDLYSVTISAPDTSDANSLISGYVVTAVGSGSQASDMQCRKLSVRLVDGNLTYAGCFDCTTFSYQPSNTCWAR